MSIASNTSEGEPALARVDEVSRIAAVAGGSGRAGGPTGPPPSAAPSDDDSPRWDLAVPVTRQVLISGPSDWTHLVTGIDTLDLGVYVDFEKHWSTLGAFLAKGRLDAERTEGLPVEHIHAGRFLIFPRGKPPQYRYHLQREDAHIFIADRPTTCQYPNVYVSLLSHALWLKGPDRAIQDVLDFVKRLGGKVDQVQASRCDLAADFYIPGGLTLDFLRAHSVSRCRDYSHHMNGPKLETFYAGGNGSAVRLRIYDKGAEIAANGGDKAWFLDVWKRKDALDVWRVEFQLRRPVLKQFKINTLYDLRSLTGVLWESLAQHWYSVRELDDDNPTRRTLHLWWCAVLQAGQALGESFVLARDYGDRCTAPVDWYISHGAGYALGYAARLGLSDPIKAIDHFAHDLRQHWQHKDFGQAYEVKRTKLGLPMTRAGGDQ